MCKHLSDVNWPKKIPFVSPSFGITAVEDKLNWFLDLSKKGGSSRKKTVFHVPLVECNSLDSIFVLFFLLPTFSSK